MSIPFSPRQFGKMDAPTTRVPLNRVVSTQHTMDESKVARMASKDMSQAPPPVVAAVGDHYVIGDGHHRVAAERRKGNKTIKVMVVR